MHSLKQGESDYKTTSGMLTKTVKYQWLTMPLNIY